MGLPLRLKSTCEDIAPVFSLCSQLCIWLESVLCDLSDDKIGLKLLVGYADWYLHPIYFQQKAEVASLISV